MELQLSIIMCQGRGQFFGSMDATAIHDHHDLFGGFAKDVHDLVNILAQGFCVKMRHDLIEDFRGAILDGADDAEQHPAGDAAPRAILEPRLPLEGFVAFDLTLTQRAGGEASALGFAPPAGAGQGKAPEHRFVFIEQMISPAGSILQGGEFDRAIRKGCRVGRQSTGGAIKAQLVFF